MGASVEAGLVRIELFLEPIYHVRVDSQVLVGEAVHWDEGL